MDEAKVQQIGDRVWQMHVFTSEELLARNREKWLAAVKWLGDKWVIAKNIERVV